MASEFLFIDARILVYHIRAHHLFVPLLVLLALWHVETVAVQHVVSTALLSEAQLKTDTIGRDASLI